MFHDLNIVVTSLKTVRCNCLVIYTKECCTKQGCIQGAAVNVCNAIAYTVTKDYYLEYNLVTIVDPFHSCL